MTLNLDTRSPLRRRILLLTLLLTLAAALLLSTRAAPPAAAAPVIKAPARAIDARPFAVADDGSDCPGMAESAYAGQPAPKTR